MAEQQQQQPIKVKFFPHHAPMETRKVACLEDIQKLVDGWVELVHFEHSDSTSILANEEGRIQSLPRNIHYPAFVGNVVVAPQGWEHLPYSLENGG
tara:strand:- start:1485 stop:1772 length:288 start_codon:yes stop_codon:yes gene_type:complete